MTDGSTLTVSNSAFDGNQFGGGGAGGAIGASEAGVTVVGSSFTDNGVQLPESEFAGGAIADENTTGASIPPLSVTASSFVGNQAGYSGGAIDTLSVAANIADSLFSANYVSGFLGGLSVAQGGAIGARNFGAPPNLSVAVTGCTFVDNQAFFSEGLLGVTAQGGAIWSQLAMTVTASTFTDNSAESWTGQAGPSPTTRGLRSPSPVPRSWGTRPWAK